MLNMDIRNTGMRIGKLRLKTFKVFQNAAMNNIPHFCAIVGANAADKPIMPDAFAFLQE